MYQVLARKWRPRSFDDLVGQDHVARTLRNALTSGRLAHAYVFAGLRGTGKTTVARLLAMCLNCEQGPTPTPCGTCDPCREIGEGRSLDVLEIDAASRTGVDDVRELQEVISYAPVRDRSKVLIVDEAHMLSKSAFNALLKTLEEPPPGVVFVLATTEAQKLLPTILSRCQLLEFRRVGVREVAGRLRTVCAAEGIEASDATLERIARAGEGSVRDSLTVLERVVACCGPQITDQEALSVLGTVKVEQLADFLQALAARDAGGLLQALDAVASEGHDLVHFWGELIGVLRDLLLRRTLGDRAEVGRAGEEMAVLEKAAAPLGREDLSRAFHLLADLEPGLRSSSQPRFLFEAALIRLADLGALRPIEEVLSSLAAGSAPAPAARRASPAPDQKKKPAEEVSAPPAPLPVPAGPAGTLEAFRAALREARPLADALLEKASVRWAEGALTIAFPAGLAAQKAGLERLRAPLEQVAAGTLGPSVQIRVVLADGEGDRAAELPAAAPATDRDSLLARAYEVPGVRRLLHEFGAQVVDIRPLEPAPGGPVEETA